MTETILLAILALVIAVIVYFGRKYINAHRQPLGARTEAILRFALMLLAALIAHAVYASHANITTFAISVLVNTFLIYGATHFFDRLLTRGRP